MKPKQTEFEKFDEVMGGLLAVPHKELQHELEKEKRAKAKKKRPKTASSRASASRKGRGT